MRDLIQRLTELSPEQRALLAARMQDQGLGRLEGTSILRRRRSGPAPLSFSQLRLWFLDQLTPADPAYHLPAALQLDGPLDVEALRRALEAIVARHEGLRTYFRSIEGTPEQVVAPSVDLPWSFVDLSYLAKAERKRAARRLSGEEMRRPFTLAKAPLIRATLLRLRPRKHILLITVHHIVSDGWSMGVLFEELGALYQAFRQGQPSPLAELPIQYPDYAIWQREWFQGALLEQELDYWRRELAGAPPTLELPTDHPRPATLGRQGGRESLVLPPDLRDALKRLGKEEGTTLFMTLLAAFGALLGRHSGQEDVVIGVPVAGRVRAETEGLIGFFINSLALRTRLDGNPTFRELLRRTREASLGAYTHQDFPFSKLVEELNPERDLGRAPIFQIFFNMQFEPSRQYSVPGLRIKRLPRDSGDARFDLTLYAKELPTGVSCTLAYSAVLFEPSTAAALMGRFQTLLQGAAANPDRHLSDLPLLTEAESGRSQPQLEPGGPIQSSELTISRQFIAQATAQPDRPAVVVQDESWSYRRVHRAARRISRAISELSADPSRIGLLLSHDVRAIAGILGVLEAGHAYVPLDALHPVSRLRFQMTDAEVTLLLTTTTHLALASELAEQRRVINLDELLGDEAIGVEEDAAFDRQVSVDPAALAYLLFTSGTTGEPKAVAQNHRNVVHWARTYAESVRLGPADCLTLLASYGFDAAVMDIFGGLLAGATLCPMDVRTELPGELVQRIRATGITVLHATPTVFRHLVSALDPGELLATTIRAVVLGGEEATRRDAELCREHCPADCLLINGLGPTECTLALQYRVEPDTRLTRHGLPVGRPVGGTEVQLLDEAGRDAQVYGEISIRSPHVALGYWRRPELTDAAFRPDPAGGDRRIYRTGDLGRRLPDGAIEFRGRKDRQIKLRGFRIELDEVENALATHPGVRHCAVVLHQDAEGSALAAYVVASPRATPTSAELLAHLQSRLPEYMVPQAIILLAQLPLLTNGKLDQRRLPAPSARELSHSDDYVAPRTPMEEQLCDIWSQVLRLERIGVGDNFFALGGHSLLATQVIARFRKSTGVTLPVRTIFERPTVAGMATVAVTLMAEVERLLDELDAAPAEPAATLPPPVRLPPEDYQARAGAALPPDDSTGHRANSGTPNMPPLGLSRRMDQGEGDTQAATGSE